MTTELPPLDLNARDASQQRWFTYLLVIAVAAANGLAGIVAGSILHHSSPGALPRPPQAPVFGANDISRWCTVWSLVERGTFQIDEIIQQPGWDTIDKGRFGDHFYSSKPPFVSTIVAGLYYVLKMTCGFDLLDSPQATVPAILLIVNWFPWVIALVILAGIGERYAQTYFSRVYLVVAAAGGTFLTTFLVTLNNHTLAACSVVFALGPLLRIANDGRQSRWLFAATGFWAAFAACCEVPAAAFGVALFALLLRHNAARTCKWFVPAALIPLAFFFYTNWLCTGGVVPFYARLGASGDTFYEYVYNGVPSYWSNPTAADRGESSSLVYFFHCTFGHHGIFSLSPIFLLTLLGWSRLNKQFPLRTVGWLSLIMTVVVLVFCLLLTNRRNYGGMTSGFRWAFWLTPLWLLGLVPAVDEWGSRRAFRTVALFVLLLSVFSVVVPRENPWQNPWLVHMFRWMRS